VSRSCSVDIETYSESDLIKVGAAAYARHPSTRILLIACKVGDDMWQDDLTCGKLSERTRQVLEDKSTIKVAWNAFFERQLIACVLGIPCPPTSWRCTQAHALYLGLPASLEKAGTAIGLKTEDKKLAASGKRLINDFCKPAKNTGQPRKTPTSDPEEWKAMLEYNVQDVVAEEAIAERIRFWPLPYVERDLWEIDQDINDRGIPVDENFVDAALHLDGELREKMTTRATELTGLENCNSRDQMLKWLQGHEQVNTETLVADDVRRLLNEVTDPVLKEVLTLRLGLARSATAKYAAFARSSCDGRIRGALQFSGASRTHRWAGRLVQPQNLARGLSSDDEIELAHQVINTRDAQWFGMLYGDPIDTLVDSVRSAIAAPPGEMFVVRDYASIEVVMLAWLANDTEMLRFINQGRDPYKEFIVAQRGIAYDDVTKAQRTYAKPVILGCGYGLGGAGLVTYAGSMGVDMDDAEAWAAVRQYREQRAAVPKLWRGLEKAAAKTIKRKTGHKFRSIEFEFDKRGPVLLMHLPSERTIAYWHPRIETDEKGREQITYNGMNQYTRQWSRIPTWGGKLVENATQSVARDVLAHGLEAVSETLEVVMHVHDEIVVCVPEEKASDSDRVLETKMGAPTWCQDAPIKTDGFIGKYYRK